MSAPPSVISRDLKRPTMSWRDKNPALSFHLRAQREQQPSKVHTWHRRIDHSKSPPKSRTARASAAAFRNARISDPAMSGVPQGRCEGLPEVAVEIWINHFRPERNAQNRCEYSDCPV